MAVYEGWAYAVFSGARPEAGNGTCPDTAFTHEIGHVMGMNHDRGKASAVEAPNATVPPVSTATASAMATTRPVASRTRPRRAAPARCQRTATSACRSPMSTGTSTAFRTPGIRISSDGLTCVLNVSSAPSPASRQTPGGVVHRLGGRCGADCIVRQQFRPAPIRRAL